MKFLAYVNNILGGLVLIVCSAGAVFTGGHHYVIEQRAEFYEQLYSASLKELSSIDVRSVKL